MQTIASIRAFEKQTIRLISIFALSVAYMAEVTGVHEATIDLATLDLCLKEAELVRLFCRGFIFVAMAFQAIFRCIFAITIRFIMANNAKRAVMIADGFRKETYGLANA